ncbi:MAG: DUF6563 family protein [Flavobacteriaceae bacterium]
MRNILSILIAIGFGNILFAQTTFYPEGSFKSFNNLISKESSKEHNLEIVKRTKGQIKFSGGNDYQLISPDKKISKKSLRKDFYAYSDGDKLYLNCFLHQIGLWYSLIEGESKTHYVFRGSTPMNPARYGIEMKDMSVLFGGLIGGLSAAKRALIRIPYVMNKESEEITLISQKNINEFLKEFPELLEAFEKEEQKGDVNILMDYLIKWVELKT